MSYATVSIHEASAKALRDAVSSLPDWKAIMATHNVNTGNIKKDMMISLLSERGIYEILSGDDNNAVYGQNVGDGEHMGEPPMMSPDALEALVKQAKARAENNGEHDMDAPLPEGLDDDEKALLEIMRKQKAEAKANAINEQKIREIVAEEMAKQEPRAVKIEIKDAPAVVIEDRVHPLFDTVTKLAATGSNILLVGPAGCGKTHLFGQVAKALGKTRVASISMTEGTTDSDLYGKLLPSKGGDFEYFPSDLVECVQDALGAFLVDEMDNSNPNTLGGLNQLFAQHEMNIAARKVSGLDSRIKRAKGSILMATANTFGTGAGALYVGRNQLDAATLDRFITIQMDYDKGYEKTLAPDHVVEWVWKVRTIISENKWRRVASTRMIQKASAMLSVGMDWKADVKRILTAGWTAEEIAKLPA